MEPKTLLARNRSAITDIDHGVAEETQRLLDIKTKPRGSLGRLEGLACQLAAIQGSPLPRIGHKAIVVMAGDHGVALEGVSAYPPQVTWQMLLNFSRGGAAINVLARQAGARLVVVDMGVNGPEAPISGVLSRRVAPGTNNFVYGPAMTPAQATLALEHGIAIVEDMVASGVDVIGIGEMGIGNSTAATALVGALSSSPIPSITGRGTGIDDATLARKISIIEKAIALNRPRCATVEGALACLGGFEIAGLAGVVLGAAARKIPVVLDGFIASTAAWVAARMEPKAANYVIASHRSVEVGHQLVLDSLGQVPLLDLEMRLGEGTGAALAMNLMDAAVAILNEMATFQSAGVSDSGK